MQFIRNIEQYNYEMVVWVLREPGLAEVFREVSRAYIKRYKIVPVLAILSIDFEKPTKIAFCNRF